MADQYSKTRMCPDLQRLGSCSRGADCRFAHSASELRAAPDLHKTKMCAQWLLGKCSAPAQLCKFAHGETELRVTQDYYKTSICKFWRRGMCSAGDACRHAHGAGEVRSKRYRHSELERAAMRLNAPLETLVQQRRQAWTELKRAVRESNPQLRAPFINSHMPLHALPEAMALNAITTPLHTPALTRSASPARSLIPPPPPALPPTAPPSRRSSAGPAALQVVSGWSTPKLPAHLPEELGVSAASAETEDAATHLSECVEEYQRLVDHAFRRHTTLLPAAIHDTHLSRRPTLPLVDFDTAYDSPPSSTTPSVRQWQSATMPAMHLARARLLLKLACNAQGDHVEAECGVEQATPPPCLTPSTAPRAALAVVSAQTLPPPPPPYCPEATLPRPPPPAPLPAPPSCPPPPPPPPAPAAPQQCWVEHLKSYRLVLAVSSQGAQLLAMPQSTLQALAAHTTGTAAVQRVHTHRKEAVGDRVVPDFMAIIKAVPHEAVLDASVTSVVYTD